MPTIHSSKLQRLLAFACGTLITFSLAPFNAWPLALISLAGLHYLLSADKKQQGFSLGAFFGIGLLLSGAHWIFVSINDYGGTGTPIAVAITLFFCCGVGFLAAPFFGFYQRYLAHTLLGSSLGFAAIFLLSEWFRTWFLTGFPWLLVGYSQVDGPLASWAPIIGTLGVGLLLAFSAALVSLSVQKRCHWAWLAAPLLLFALGPWLNTLDWTQKKSDKAYSVALVQGNTPLEEKWDPAYKDAIMQNYLDDVEALNGTDIILLPETALPEYLHRARPWLKSADKALSLSDSALITGIIRAEFGEQDMDIYNTLTTAGMAFGTYDKQKLVPFGEYVPFERWLRKVLDFPMSSFSRGASEQKPLLAKDLAVQPYICYEITYPNFVSDSAQHSDLLLTVSNDLWFGRSIGPLQHLQMARMRALETGRYLLRATNNGVTAVIDHKGKIIKQIPSFERGILKSEVYAMQGLTPVMQYGTLPSLIFGFLVLAFSLVRHYLLNR